MAYRPGGEVLERRQLLSTYLVTTAADDPSLHSLRWAILQVDADTGADTIAFDLPGPGPQVIHLGAPLPAIVNSVLIDGTTQAGYQGAPRIEIDGSGLGPGSDGLVISAGASTIRGVALVGFSGSAIVLESRDNRIEGDYLGVTPSGTTALPNGQGISLVGSSGNTIGNGAGGAGNVISGNTGDGIRIQPGATASSDNLITGNRIGTTADGTGALANGQSGLAIEASPANRIGLPEPGFGNLISGNLGAGISLSGGSAGTQILGNTIGLAADGQTPLGNGGDGIMLDDAPATQIGDVEPGAGNVIGANGGAGIQTSGDTAGLSVEGNGIGTDLFGLLKVGNLGGGIVLGSSSNTIGGTALGAGNLIEFNGSGQVGAGVQLVGPVNRNTILSNSIYANAGLGIDLGGGPTPNHAPGTPGPNDYQNYPELSTAQSDGHQTTIQGTLFESPDTPYLLQFFASPTPDPTGYGQGKTLLGSTLVTTDDTGQATVTFAAPTAAIPGQFVSATATSPAGDTSEFSAVTVVQGRIDLDLTAAAAPDPVLAGGDVTYTLVVTNEGAIAAHDVILSDQLPATVQLVSAAESQGYALPRSSRGSVGVDLGTIAAGASATVTLVVQTGAGSVGSITDTATVTSQEVDPNPADESASVTTTVQAAADLAVAMTESPSPALAGGDMTYTITVSNQGPMAAGHVVATLPIATGAAFVSAGPDGTTVTSSGGRVVADLGSLAAGGQATLTVVLQALAVGDLTETATVSGDVADPDSSNNTASVTTEVDPAADLAVQIAASPLPAATGHVFDYIATVTNAGPDDATGVVVSDTLPAGVSFVAASTDPGVLATFTNGVVAATFTSLAAGASASLTIAVAPTAPPGATLSDSATVAGQQADPDPANNAATLNLPVRGVSDLAVAAAARPGSPVVGQPLTYTISVTNQGPADEPDAVLTGALPAGLAVRSATATQGAAPAVSRGALTADLGPLPAGATAVVTLVVIPGPGAAGTLTADFAARGQDLDLDPSNDTAAVTVLVAPSADVAVGISGGSTPAVAQVDWTYTVVVSNAGPSGATGVTATAPLPPDVVFVSASSSQGAAPTEQDGLVSAGLGTLAAGQSATLTVIVRPAPAAAGAGSIALSASVVAAESDPDPGNNRATLTVPVAPSVSLAVSLAAAPQAVASGQTITFTATVTNTGSTPASGVVLSLPPAAGLACDSWAPTQGTAALVAGQLAANLGVLDPGSSATLIAVETATAPGTLTQAASVSASQANLDPQGGRASATVQVAESPGTVQFGTSELAVSELAGWARIPVVRLYGARGTITVDYQTVAVNATPGRDYVPTSGTLTLGPGQTTGTITVPVLADPYDNHDEILDVVLSHPTGGAILGGVSTAVLRIQDVDPDTTPPQVSGLSWAGSPRSITSLTLSFTAPLDPRFASDPADYRLVDLARGGAIPIASIRYDAATDSVTIVPASPLRAGHYDQIQVIGTGPTAVRDLAGNLLDGDGTGTPGSDYLASFAQGTRLKYVDNAGNHITLWIQGPGYLEQVRDSSGRGTVLKLIGIVPHRTTLGGSIKGRRGSGGQTNLGTIQGLGQFGDVRVRLKTPPFFVRQYPFQWRGRAVL